MTQTAQQRCNTTKYSGRVGVAVRQYGYRCTFLSETTNIEILAISLRQQYAQQAQLATIVVSPITYSLHIRQI